MLLLFKMSSVIRMHKWFTQSLFCPVLVLIVICSFYRDGGMKGLFTGVGPRVARAGPSVGIVVSFYEVVKLVLHRQHCA